LELIKLRYRRDLYLLHLFIGLWDAIRWFDSCGI